MILHVRRYTSGTEDAHGNADSDYAEPVEWDVLGVAPGGMAEPYYPDRDLSDIAWTVYALPSDNTPTERDRVDFDGDTYEVNGRPKDWTHGPWQNPSAGIVVELKRTEG